ncbi:MAG: NAD(P)/FAD-dependent oxidoreductase [Deltaproteobacteria bacterium]|nr:NAD(P)/FAD-dependent oxidoreductase [Deltaproteobacteria bacterium]
MPDKTQVLIVGQGPAGLSAAIYTGRAGYDTLILGCPPKVAGDYEIDNYFGFSETISGRELIDRGIAQARRFGVDIRCDRVLGIHHGQNSGFHVRTEKGEVEADAVILATGVSRIRPGISNLGDYEGKGVSYCVSCDGFFFKGARVVVAGEGVFAANQALELLQYTPHVTVCTQGKAPTMTQEFRDRLDKMGIPVLEDKIVTLEGQGTLQSMVLESGQRLEAEGLFIAMGEASSNDFAYTLGLERRGVFIDADCDQKTNIPGVFAAGDCVGRFLQISVAVGEGAKAARAAINHLKKVN